MVVIQEQPGKCAWLHCIIIQYTLFKGNTGQVNCLEKVLSQEVNMEATKVANHTNLLNAIIMSLVPIKTAVVPIRLHLALKNASVVTLWTIALINIMERARIVWAVMSLRYRQR